MMTLSWADRRLGAEEHEALPVSGAATESVAERAVDLHAVRPADCAGTRGTAAAPVEPWVDTWQRSLRMQRELREQEMARRRVRERQYCEQIRDAKGEGRTPLSADEFFSRPTP